MLGFTDRDRMRLRFSFEAPGRRQAVELAGLLRTMARCSVQVRRARLRLRGPRPWTVTVKTPPAPLALEVIRCWEAEMSDAVGRRPGCRLVGWQPVLLAGDVNRILLVRDSLPRS
jgi:hypothetical protein